MAENLPTRARGTPTAAHTRPPAPPKHLSLESKRIWRQIVGEWVLGPEALPLLRAGLESWDLYQSARAQLTADGPTVKTGKGMVRIHPAARIGDSALTQFRQCFRQLGLEPPEQ